MPLVFVRTAAWVAAQEVRRWASCHGDGHSDDSIQYRGVDLGSGLGTVMLMLCWVFADAQYVSIEAQPASVDRCNFAPVHWCCHPAVGQ
jgi:hypothetical protein